VNKKALDLSRELIALTAKFQADAQKAALVGKRKGRKTESRRGGRAKWPMVSDRAGCMPNQVEEANENCRKMGLAARYDPAGFVHLPSARARAAHLKSIGQSDFSS
jgi:hypothetical protein